MKRSKKKALANRKLTIIKVLPKDGTISQEDLHRWHEIFRNNLMTPEAAMKTGEVEVQTVPVARSNDHFLTLVKVGTDDYKPTNEDLEQWRDVFEKASVDPDFKIFTHHGVSVEVIELGNVVAVE
jgi:hypothetical protein